MIKWPITYTDYNGDTQTEELYFNINKAEVLELNLNANGAYGEYLQRIVNLRDGAKIASEFKKIILMAYGEKSADGRRFIKSQDMRDAFEQSEAYSELYVQLATDPAAAEKFIKGVLPAESTGAPLPAGLKTV